LSCPRTFDESPENECGEFRDQGSLTNKISTMPESAVQQVREQLDALYRAESGRILATLIRLLGDFDLAEDALHGALASALG
jgi:RNA polymerase sigma-70 factor (ECF subfamily)